MDNNAEVETPCTLRMAAISDISSSQSLSDRCNRGKCPSCRVISSITPQHSCARTYPRWKAKGHVELTFADVLARYLAQSMVLSPLAVVEYSVNPTWSRQNTSTVTADKRQTGEPSSRDVVDRPWQIKCRKGLFCCFLFVFFSPLDFAAIESRTIMTTPCARNCFWIESIRDCGRARSLNCLNSIPVTKILSSGSSIGVMNLCFAGQYCSVESLSSLARQQDKAGSHFLVVEV
jgi:hypothetical protein